MFDWVLNMPLHSSSSLPFPPAHEHSDIYLQFCIWYDYLLFQMLFLYAIYRSLEISIRFIDHRILFVDFMLDVISF